MSRSNTRTLIRNLDAMEDATRWAVDSVHYDERSVTLFATGYLGTSRGWCVLVSCKLEGEVLSSPDVTVHYHSSSGFLVGESLIFHVTPKVRTRILREACYPLDFAEGAFRADEIRPTSGYWNRKTAASA